MPIAGGLPQRLTGYGTLAEVAGWSPKGEVQVNTRYHHPMRKLQLVAVPRASRVWTIRAVMHWCCFAWPIASDLIPDNPLASFRPMNDRRSRSIGPETAEPCAFLAGHRKHQAILAGVLMP